MYLLNLKNVRCFGVNISLKLILPIFLNVETEIPEIKYSLCIYYY